MSSVKTQPIGAEEILEDEAQLEAWMRDGCKPPADWRIGTEHEKFGFRKSDLSPLPYEGADGINAMLEGLMQFGWQGKYEDDKIIGLSRKGGVAVSLEPAGQLELAGAPVPTLHDTHAELRAHLDEVRVVAETLGQSYMGIGYSPLWGLDDAPRMPKGRYELMEKYMPTRGGRGLEMMLLTATVQVNLDFASEADMAEKLRIGLALQPLATALFANSPFRDARATGHLSERSLTWTDTDPDRTGMLELAFSDDFGFARYVDYALDVPMYFVIRDGRFIDALGMNFRDFLAGRLPALPNEKPTGQDWENHLTTLFPEARVKRFIEMRGADSGSEATICALSAFWVGLLYDAATQRRTAALIADWSAEERETLRRTAPISGLATPFRGGTLRDVAVEVLALSEGGLRARAIKDAAGRDETHFLAPLHAVVESGLTPAEMLLKRFRDEWKEDVRPVFEALAF